MRRLKVLRVLFAAAVFAFANLFFFGLVSWASLLFKIQLLPAVLALNIVAVAVVLGVTALFGRIYCSVACPMGILQDCVIAIRRLLTKRCRQPRCPLGTGRRLRYVSLGVSFALFVCGFTSLGALLDGYSLYGRIAAQVLRPCFAALNNLVAAACVRAGHPWLIREEVFFAGGCALIVAVCGFVGIVMLAWMRSRWFCTALCPVGAALSVVSTRPMVKIKIDTSKCVSCGLCTAACPCGAIDPSRGHVDQSSCVRCFNCLSECRKGAVRFG